MKVLLIGALVLAGATSVVVSADGSVKFTGGDHRLIEHKGYPETWRDPGEGGETGAGPSLLPVLEGVRAGVSPRTGFSPAKRYFLRPVSRAPPFPRSPYL